MTENTKAAEYRCSVCNSDNLDIRPEGPTENENGTWRVDVLFYGCRACGTEEAPLEVH